MILIFFSLNLLAACSEEGSSQDVDIILEIEKPIVSKSKYTFFRPDGDEVNVSGPWFEFTYTITNGSDKPLTVVDWEAKVTARDGDTTTEKTYTPDFGDFDATRTRINQSPITKNGGTFDEPADWYIDSLPELDSARYRVEITFSGYFETEDDPDTDDVNEGGKVAERFEKTIQFSTR